MDSARHMGQEGVLVTLSPIIFRGSFPVRRPVLQARDAAAAWLGHERCGFGLFAISMGMGMSVGVFDVFRGDFVGCPRCRDVIGVVFSKGVVPRCDVRPISCVLFSQ